MKKPLLTTLAAVFMLQARAQTFTHAPVPVTGFTADVIADGSGPAANSTSTDVDGANYNFVAQNFVNPTNQSPTSYLPANGLINSLVTPGLSFQLAPYTGNNSLRLITGSGTNVGTLTFATPRLADKVNVLVTTANPSTFTATVNFTDATSQAFTGNSVPNWFDGASPAIQGVSRVLRTTNAIENSSTNPRMYQYSFVLSAANATKTIESITFTKTTTNANEILHVFAVTASMANANDAGISAITAPVSPVTPGVNQPVTVTVKNYGASPLTAATLGFSVNGTTVLNNYAFSSTPGLATNAVSTPVAIGNFTFPTGIHTVKAWSNLPNGLTDPVKGNDTVQVSLVACNTLSGNYTINKNAPVSATNFPSFTTAVQMLANCGVSGPVTLSVVPNSGPYNEQVTIPVIPGASATNTVTFEGNNNLLTANPTGSTPGVIVLHTVDFVKLNNLRITVDAAATSAMGVQLLNGADNNSITNCTINVPMTSIASSLSGIVAGPNNASTGNYANNLLLQNNIINGGYQGILLNGSATVTGNRVLNNQIRDSYNYGIYLNVSGNGTVVENNDISRPTRTNVTLLYGIYITGANTNVQISRNRIHNTHDAATVTTGAVHGIYISATSASGSENIIKNNLIYNLNNNGGMVNGVTNQGSSHCYIYHNTISLDNLANAYAAVRGMNIPATVTNVKFINNLVSLSSSGTTKHAIYVGSSTATLVSNNNDFYIGSSGNVGYFSGDKATLADWKAANSSAYDQNSVSIDPVFVSLVYPQPLATTVDNLGQPVAAVTTDVNGATRSTTTPDMGAIEFTPAATDAGVTAINAPTSPVTPGSQPVTVTLKNFGTATLIGAKIGWSVNGVTQPEYTWNGSVATLQTTASPVTIGNFTFAAGNHTIKAWTKNPNNATDALAVNDTTTLRVISCAPLNGAYTVNKNNPTAGTNFQSLSAVASRLAECGVAGPVTVTVTAGTGPYNEQVEILSIPNTSATNTVTFEGSGNTVSTTPGMRPGIIVLNGADYVKLNNFVIEAPATATIAYGIQLINGADYNTISNNTINMSLTSTATAINGIVSGTSVSTAGNNASYTKIHNNVINGGYYGVQLNGNTGGVNGVNNQITNNQFKDQSNYGIFLNHTNGTLIESNDISRPNRTNSPTMTGVYTTGTTQGTIISKNRFHNTHDLVTATAGAVYGVYISSAGVAGNENIVKNNVMYNIKPINGTFNGFFNSGGSHTYYYYNTVVAETGHNYLGLRGISFNGTSTNVKFINNIVSLNGSATNSAKYAIYLPASGVTLQSNNNDLFVGTLGNVGYLGGDKTTLTDWQTAGAYDLNSVLVDPVFVNAATGNLKPTLAILNDKGQPVTNVTEDILGAARHATTPDLGAYEFGVPANDVGIITVAVANTTGCGLTATETVTVTLQNFGATTQTSVPVSYSVNGVAIAAPETFTGSLASNATATYTFTTKANLSAPNQYQIIAKTMLAGDLEVTNDSDTITVGNYLLTTMPTAFNFETAATGIANFRQVVRAKSNLTEATGASNGATSTKGLIMDGVDNTNWLSPTGLIDPWTNNAANFAGAYLCISPASMNFPSAMWLNFDLKQLFKVANVNTNFRVTVNGVQVGPTYRPPFTGTPINWQKVSVDLSSYKNAATLQIGLESSVKEAFANGTGTANLIDNMSFNAVSKLGVKENVLAAQLHVFPNPSTGNFFISLPQCKTYQLEITDLTGRIIKTETVKGDARLNLEKAAKGIYLLKVSGENGTAFRKLIVE